jgi:hypothetical protein
MSEIDMGQYFSDSGADTGFGSEEALIKAMSAGYGTDSATFTGGRALIPEDCEATMVIAMREQREDCKIMNTFKKIPVGSTVHEYNRVTDSGNIDFGTTEEGGESEEEESNIERVVRSVKYIQEYRAVTEQMKTANSFGSTSNAYELQKLLGTINVLKKAERLCIHGNASVVPTEFDGLIRQIESTNKDRRNILDFRGQTIMEKGEGFFAEMTRMIYDQGGEANKIFFPTIFSEDIQALCRDRIRFGEDSKSMYTVFRSYPTPMGTLAFGEDSGAGANKMFRIKSKIKSVGHPDKKPNAPSDVTLTFEADTNDSQFTTADGGNYIYEVFAINRHGISEGKKVNAPVAVSGRGSVKIEIKAAASKSGTGYIICRSDRNGNVTMEMVRIGRDKTKDTTAYVDLNNELPGTSEIIFITEKKLQTVAEWAQFLPLRLFPKIHPTKLIDPFILALWGYIDLKVPEWCGLAKNIAYSGGLYVPKPAA